MRRVSLPTRLNITVKKEKKKKEIFPRDEAEHSTRSKNLTHLTESLLLVTFSSGKKCVKRNDTEAVETQRKNLQK